MNIRFAKIFVYIIGGMVLSSPAYGGFNIKKYVKEKVVDPVHEHVIAPLHEEVLDPIKEHLLQPVGEYFSDRVKDSGSNGSKMSVFSVPRDARITINSSGDPYPGMIASATDHYGNRHMHFICESDAEVALKNHRIFYKPISRGQFCNLKTRHHANRFKNGYERERLKAGCNTFYATENHVFFRCWDADIEKPEVQAAIKERARELNRPKLDQLEELQKTHDKMLQGKLDDLSEKDKVLDLTIERQKHENTLLQRKIDMTLSYLNKEKEKFEQRLKVIYSRIKNFNQKLELFANEQMKSQQDRRQITDYLGAAIPIISKPDLNMDELKEVRNIYQEMMNKNYFRLCESDHRSNLLKDLRILHSNTRLLVNGYGEAVNAFRGNTDLDISLFKNQMLKHADSLEKILDPMDQIYLDFYGAIDDHLELCIQFKRFQSLLNERERLIQQVEKTDDYKGLALKIQSILNSHEENQRILVKIESAETEMGQMFQVCLDDCGSNRLTEAMKSCDGILERLKNYAKKVESNLNHFSDKSVDDIFEARLAEFEKIYILFIKDKLTKDKLRTLRARFTGISAKIIKVDRNSAKRSTLRFSEIKDLMNQSIFLTLGGPWPSTLPKLSSDLEIMEFDAKLSTIEEEIDQLIHEWESESQENSL